MAKVKRHQGRWKWEQLSGDLIFFPEIEKDEPFSHYLSHSVLHRWVYQWVSDRLY